MFNIRIKMLRKQLKMTQKELGKKAGFKQQEISYIELGIRKRFSNKEISKLATALGVTVDELFREEKITSGTNGK